MAAMSDIPVELLPLDVLVHAAGASARDVTRRIRRGDCRAVVLGLRKAW